MLEASTTDELSSPYCCMLVFSTFPPLLYQSPFFTPSFYYPPLPILKQATHSNTPHTPPPSPHSPSAHSPATGSPLSPPSQPPSRVWRRCWSRVLSRRVCRAGGRRLRLRKRGGVFCLSWKWGRGGGCRCKRRELVYDGEGGERGGDRRSRDGQNG